MNNVSFTGHRDISIARYHIVLYDTLEKLIDDGSDMFFAGGAAGFDTLAAETVLQLKTVYPWITLTLILPCSPEEQTRSFSERMKQRYFEIMQSADKVEQISPYYTPECMKQRNQRLIDFADICVCCYDERRAATGTGQTVRMAQKKGITVINLFEE